MMDSASTPASDAGRGASQAFPDVVEALIATGVDPASALCKAGAQILGCSGVGIMLIAGTSLTCIASSDRLTESVDAFEHAVGEGPCVDAFRTGEVCFEPDLADERSTSWMAFRRGALALGVRAAFGVPLTVDGTAIGALTCYGTEPGPLTPSQRADMLTVADASARTIVRWQCEAGADNLAWQLERSVGYRIVIQHAVGMVAAQAQTSVEHASVLLRAHAYAHDRALVDVAADVLAGILNFQD